MCGCFGRRTIEIEQRFTQQRPPIKTYQFVRSASNRSQLPMSTATIRHPSTTTKSGETTFRSLEVDDFYSTPHDDRARRYPPEEPFHPLPPVIHQHSVPRHQDNDHHLFGALQGPPRHIHSQRPDNRTLMVEDHPERAIARLPKRVVRVHRSHTRRRSSSRKSQTRSSGGRYHHYHPDGSHYSGDTRAGDGDSWADGASGRGGTLTNDWSDGGDSWDEGQGPSRGRQIEGRTTRRDRSGRRGYYLT